MRDRSRFAIIIAVSALVFCLSLGLCGLTADAGETSAHGSLFAVALWVEGAGVVLSFVTIFATLLHWLEVVMWERRSRASPGIQKFVDETKRNKE